MSNLVVARLAVALVGLVVWFYGYREGLETVRWIGIAIIAAAVILRFFGPRPLRRGERPGPPEPP